MKTLINPSPTLKQLGFTPGDEIWVTAAWEKQDAPPADWTLNKQGVPVHRVFTGTVAADGLNLRECRYSGKDSDGDSLWKATPGFAGMLSLNQLAKQGAAIYFYPNKPQGGICNKHIEKCDLLFYETDNAAIEAQWENLERFLASTELVPALVVYSGGKSLHVYFKLSAPLSAADFQRLQRKLCIIQNSDPLVTNPARAMRLPHMPRGQKQVSVEFTSDETYAPTHVEAKLDELGLFPYGLADERWRAWVALRNRQAKGEAIDPTQALLTAEVSPPRPPVSFRLRLRPPAEATDSVRIDRLIREALAAIPPRRPGEGTYDQYRLILTVLCQHYGEAEGVSMMEAHSPSAECGWNIPQVARSTRTSGDYRPEALFALAQKHYGWTFPDWAKTYPQVDKSPPQLKPNPPPPAAERAIAQQHKTIAAQQRKRQLLKGRKQQATAGSVIPFDLAAYKQQKKIEKYQRKLKEMKAALNLDCQDEAIGAAIWRSFYVQGERKAATCAPIRYVAPGQRRLIALDAPKANRKTSRALKGLVEEALAIGKRVYVITSTRILSIAAGETLAVASHAAAEDWRGYPAHVVCPESLWHWGDLPSPHVIILDEAEVVLPRLLRATLAKGRKKYLIRKAFIEALQTAEMAVLSQDGLSNAAVDAVRILGQFKAEDVDYQLYSMPKPLQGLTTIRLYSDWQDPLKTEAESWDGAEPKSEHGHQRPGLNGWFNRLQHCLEQGERVVIACGSEANGRALSRLFRAIYPARKVVIFDGKHTPSRVKSAFAQDCNGWILAHQPDVLIYTPLFNDGVSIELDYFEAIFEWTSPCETANSSSQRGERIRAALGFVIQDGEPVPSKLTVRHIYLSNSGNHMSDSPGEELGLAEITARVREEFLGQYRQVKPGGIGRHLQAEIELTEQLVPLIARFDQLEWVSKYQRKALLEHEWREKRGWKIVLMGGTQKSNCPLAHKIDQIKADMENQRARIQAATQTQHLHPAKLKALRNTDRPGPIGQYRMTRLQQEEMLGADFTGLNVSQWQLAWAVVTDSSMNLANLQTRALILLDHAHPGLLNQLAQESAAAVLRGGHGLCAPVHNMMVQHAIRERDCPGVLGVLTEERTEWHKDDPEIQAAAAYILKHRVAFAAYSKWKNPSGRALVFSKNTPTVKLFHKALGLVGVKTTLDRVEGKYRRRTYRKLTEADVEKKIKAAIATNDPQQVREEDIQRVRVETEAGTYAHISKQIKEKLEPILATTEEERSTFLSQLLSPLMLSVLRERMPACLSSADFIALSQEYELEHLIEVWRGLSERARARINALFREAV